MALTHDDYTIAWICALPLEMTAARATLDETHRALPQPSTDHNAYALGRLGDHNVVIACLPAGIYGTTSATTVLAHMLPTFPSLRFGLMVGIGGGAPSKNADIRLGDVVVSIPSAGSGGVVQYDYGKTMHDSQFRRTGSLNKPPQILLTAVSKLRSDDMIRERPYSSVISDTLQTYSEMRAQFSRPSNDWLFDSAYDHDSSDSDCSTCDLSRLIDRDPRPTEEPFIHYGLIASGNQVMKDAKTRDSIAQETGILCFEMEAAGLMDQLPCLWQGYAALAAAVYTKILVATIPTLEKKKKAESKFQALKQSVWMVPFHRNQRFTGREEQIAEIEGWILQEKPADRIAICGLGGVGKTQIALELAYRARERDPSCSVFWISCTSYASVEQAYMKLAQLIGIDIGDSSEVKEEAKEYLSQVNSGKWLLIFDNADDMEMWVQSRPALKTFLPRNQQGHTLFTSRNRTLANRIGSTHILPISEPNEETGLRILENSFNNQSLPFDRNAALELLEQLAYLPLAIVQAAAYINENQINISEYVELLHEQESDIIELLSEDFEDEGRYSAMQNPVATTWWISFQQIRHLNQLAAQYLCFIACISPRNVPHSLLPQSSSKNEHVKAVGLLKAYSFVTTHTEVKSLSLHRLVHLAVRSWLRHNNLFNQEMFNTADRLAEVFPHPNNDNRDEWREYLPHALYLIGESECQNQESYLQVMVYVAICLELDARYNEAEEVLLQITTAPESTGFYEQWGAFLLSDIYQSQKRFEDAENLQKQVLDALKEAWGPSHPNTLILMEESALTYSRQGRWGEAEELQAQVIETRKTVLGPSHPATLLSATFLGTTYYYQGRLSEAEELLKLAMNTLKAMPAPSHWYTIICMSDLALTCSWMGKRQEALDLIEECTERSKKVMGPDHPSTISFLKTLSEWRTTESSDQDDLSYDKPAYYIDEEESGFARVAVDNDEDSNMLDQTGSDHDDDDDLSQSSSCT